MHTRIQPSLQAVMVSHGFMITCQSLVCAGSAFHKLVIARRVHKGSGSYQRLGRSEHEQGNADKEAANDEAEVRVTVPISAGSA